MATWYRVGRYSNDVEAIEVVKETDKTIFYQEAVGLWARTNHITRQAKNSSWAEWFPTEQEAVQFIYNRFKYTIKGHEARCAAELKEFEAFKKKYGIGDEEVTIS